MHRVHHLLLALLLGCSSVRGLQSIDCGSFWAIDDLQVENCLDTAPRCSFEINRNTTVSFTLNSNGVSIASELINEVTILMGGIRFVMEVSPVNACAELACPVAQNYVGTYSFVVTVSDNFIPGYASLEYILRTSSNQQMLCALATITLIDPV